MVHQGERTKKEVLKNETNEKEKKAEKGKKENEFYACESCQMLVKNNNINEKNFLKKIRISP